MRPSRSKRPQCLLYVCPPPAPKYKAQLPRPPFPSHTSEIPIQHLGNPSCPIDRSQPHLQPKITHKHYDKMGKGDANSTAKTKGDSSRIKATQVQYFPRALLFPGRGTDVISLGQGRGRHGVWLLWFSGPGCGGRQGGCVGEGVC
ncbi:hypothetical protein K505DRAFT_140804 [Melanomma pulvis-pyrius CBS 109.77]|uniref:Uncharacterized protein n=1 Tax=Melanomma pulvis-pyrius CBS 109.77 TaxID=1314802 RepID=A0A6A6XLN5_9PLEO|nr:hypothetical protein K505DRAFT_140804 [Melanomma pulvis-pyrius CBS 109.77]